MDPLSQLIWRYVVLPLTAAMLLCTGFWKNAHAQTMTDGICESGGGCSTSQLVTPSQAVTDFAHRQCGADGYGGAYDSICHCTFIQSGSPTGLATNFSPWTVAGTIDDHICTNSTTRSDWGIGLWIAQICPGGSQSNGSGGCACPSGQQWNGSQCIVPPVVCPTGPGPIWVTQAASPRLTVCYPVPGGDCGLTGTVGPGYSLGGTSFVTVSSTWTGTTCTPGDVPNAAPGNQNPTPAPNTFTPISTPESQCIDGGGSWGQFNGNSTCLPAGSGAPNAPTSTSGTPTTTTTTTTNSDGSTTTNTTTTTTSTTTDSSGTGTTTTNSSGYNVTCPSGTAPPSKAAAGSVPAGCTGSAGSSSSSTGAGGTCPAGQTCGGDDQFGGSCAAGFSCSGDAIQCAIAKEQYQTTCKVFGASNQLGTDVDAQTYLGSLSGDQTAAAASSPIRSAIKANQSKVDASSASFDQTGFYGGGACPSPTIGFGSFSVAVPGMTLLCSNIQGVGLVLVGLTAVLCFMLYARILGS